MSASRLARSRARGESEEDGAYFDNVGTHSIAVSDLVHVPFEIHVEEFEDEVQFRFRVCDVEQPSLAQVVSLHVRTFPLVSQEAKRVMTHFERERDERLT